MGGEGYYLEYLLVLAFVFFGLLLVCVPRPRKRNMLTPEQEAQEKKKQKKKKAHAAKKKKTARK